MRMMKISPFPGRSDVPLKPKAQMQMHNLVEEGFFPSLWEEWEIQAASVDIKA
jgi:hypothetical protein